MRLPEIESPAQNISTHPSLEPRVPRIAIVGAGFVGSTTAFALMMSGMAAEIVLIDRDSRRAEGHVNDLRDAEVFSHTTRIFVGDFSDCCSADVTIVTAGVSQSGQKSRMEGLHDTGAILHGLVNDVCLQNPPGILYWLGNISRHVALSPPISGTLRDCLCQRSRIRHRRTWRQPNSCPIIGSSRGTSSR